MSDGDTVVEIAQISPDELQAIDEHRYYLSERAGFDVGRAAAISDWQANHARHWHWQKPHRELNEQMQDMLRHKWIESQKAGQDVGDGALLDWIRKHAAQWREKQR